MGVPRALRPAAPRRDRCLGRRIHHHLLAARLQRSLLVARLRSRRSQRGRIRSHLPGSVVLHAETLPETPLEPRPSEQAVPTHRRVLEWMGCCCSLLAVSVACYGADCELYVLSFFFRGDLFNVLIVDRCPHHHVRRHHLRAHLVLCHAGG